MRRIREEKALCFRRNREQRIFCLPETAIWDIINASQEHMGEYGLLHFTEGMRGYGF